MVSFAAPEAQIKLDLSHDRGASRKKPGFVSADEAEYLGKLIAKHGDDYKVRTGVASKVLRFADRTTCPNLDAGDGA